MQYEGFFWLIEREFCLFFLLFDVPVLEVFGEDLNISFLHNVVDDCRGDFELCHGLVRPLPEPFLFGGSIGQVEFGNQLSEFLEHYRVKIVVVS